MVLLSLTPPVTGQSADQLAYQGFLQEGGAPANGTYDFSFALFDAASGGNFLGQTLATSIRVKDGHFLAPLDFLDSEASDGGYLEISVRSETESGFTPLAARRALGAGRGTCAVNENVEINGQLVVDRPGTVPDLTVTCCNDVDNGGQVRIDGFLQSLLIDSNELQAVDLGGPSDLLLNADGGHVGIGVADPQAPLHLPSGPDVTPSGGGALVLGSLAGENIAIDDNEIMARNNGSPDTLALNNNGGDVRIGGLLDIGLVRVSNFAGAGVADVQVDCPAGKYILAGGCAGADDVIESSYPLDSNTWKCEFDDSSLFVNYAYAICGRIKW